MRILNRLIADIAYNNESTGLNAQTLQEAIDALYQLVLSSISLIDGGTPQTLETEFTVLMDGGSPTTQATQTIDGGSV
jgi:hypothetical protein